MSNKKFDVIIVKSFIWMRALFGLYVFETNYEKRAVILIVQRTIAAIWMVLYTVSATEFERGDFRAELQIKSSLIVRVLPTFILTMLSISTFLTLLFTHVFVEERMRLIKQVVDIDSKLNYRKMSLHPRGSNLMIAIVLLQSFYIIFWFLLAGPIDYYGQVNVYECIVGVLPRFVSTFFFMDYFVGNTIMLQQFIKNNEALQLLQKKSLQSMHYPEDERLFREQLIDISNKHRKLCTIVKGSNRIYSLQLLVNIALLYAVLLARAYTTIYAMLSTDQNEVRIKIIFVSLVHLIVNAGTLLLLVEISTRICQEVSKFVIILLFLIFFFSTN